MLEGLKIRSIYHELYPCTSGEETHPTFYHYHKVDHPYHIDYVFASEGLHCSSLDIGTHEEWHKRSDHMPMVCDFNDQ